MIDRGYHPIIPSERKIMIIDTDPESLDLMSQHLRACGYRVVGLRTTQSLVKRVLKEELSLIIVDLMLPQRNGLKVCRELKSDYAAQYIPIIMVSAMVHESDKIVAFELGVDDYMKKPLNLHELSLRVERSLDRAQAKFR